MDTPRKCLHCGNLFAPEHAHDDEGYSYEVNSKLCYTCFEDGVEAHEEKRREHITLKNEY